MSVINVSKQFTILFTAKITDSISNILPVFISSIFNFNNGIISLVIDSKKKLTPSVKKLFAKIKKILKKASSALFLYSFIGISSISFMSSSSLM